MQAYRIQGADEQTGGDVSVTVQAGSETEAQELARSQGVLTSQIDTIGEPPAYTGMMFTAGTFGVVGLIATLAGLLFLPAAFAGEVDLGLILGPSAVGSGLACLAVHYMLFGLRQLLIDLWFLRRK